MPAPDNSTVAQDYPYGDEIIGSVVAAGNGRVYYTFVQNGVSGMKNATIQAQIISGAGVVVKSVAHSIENTLDAVAQFGDTTYPKLQTALDAAEAAGGGTVTLLTNVTEDADIIVPAGVTLDLTDKVLTVNGNTLKKILLEQ